MYVLYMLGGSMKYEWGLYNMISVLYIVLESNFKNDIIIVSFCMYI